LHAPEELELLEVIPLELLPVMPLELLAVALLVALAPASPPAPPELPDWFCCSTTVLLHAMREASIETAALRVRRMIIRGGYAISFDDVQLVKDTRLEIVIPVETSNAERISQRPVH
jgi:hypothetical protein